METSTWSRLRLTMGQYQYKISCKNPVINLLNCSSHISCFLCLQVSCLLSRRDRVMMRKGNSRLGLCKADLRGDFCYKFASQLIKCIFTGIQVAINLKQMMFRILQAIELNNLHRLLQLSCEANPAVTLKSVKISVNSPILLWYASTSCVVWLLVHSSTR